MSGSITRLVQSISDQPDESIRALWRRFDEECRNAAKRSVSSKLQRSVDSDQIAIDAFYCFCRKVAEGAYPDLQDREAIWKLLSTLIHQEAGNQVRKELRAKRGGGDRRGESVFIDTPGGLAAHHSHEETPDSLALSSEQIANMFAALPEELRLVAEWKAEGESNVTIARRLGCDPATIKYRLDKIARLWTKLLV
jgi:hypothetical protein